MKFDVGENDLVQSFSKSAEKTKKSRKIASAGCKQSHFYSLPFGSTISIAVFSLQNLICLLVIFADQAFIDPTLFGIFVCDPLHSAAVYLL